MKKISSIIFIIVFLGLCAAPLAGWIFGYENTNAENRAMAAAPKLVDEDGLNTEYTIEFDDYFTDTFAFRSDLITAHAYLKGGVLGESVSDRVIIGSGGWLFFSPTLGDYTRSEVLSDADIDTIAQSLIALQKALDAQGTQLIFTVAPNKSTIYPHYMPGRYFVQDSRSNLEKLADALEQKGVNYVDLWAQLEDSSRRQLYHKLDTHWNGTGAMIAYDALMSEVQSANEGFNYHQYGIADFTPEQTWQGDLSAMLYPSAGILDVQHVYGVLTEYSTARPLRSLEDLGIEATCETGSLRAVMFRDSFANALIPILSNEFASITYSRATPYDLGLIFEQTDVVIIQIVERNIPDLLESISEFTK